MNKLSTANLIRDHEIIKKVINSLEKKLIVANKKGEISINYLKSFVKFAKKFIDKCHHKKEEKCLFPCLEYRGIQKEGGPIGVMLIEHELGRRIISKISERIDLYEKGSVELKEILRLCFEFIELIKSHILKEENILFKMGDQVMTNHDDNENIKCYEKIEDKKEHEEIEKLAREIL